MFWFDTGDTHLLLPATVEVDGRPLRLMNDLDIDSDGNIYFSDSSGYQRRDFFLDVLDGRAAGRLESVLLHCWFDNWLTSHGGSLNRVQDLSVLVVEVL